MGVPKLTAALWWAVGKGTHSLYCCIVRVVGIGNPFVHFCIVGCCGHEDCFRTLVETLTRMVAPLVAPCPMVPSASHYAWLVEGDRSRLLLSGQNTPPPPGGVGGCLGTEMGGWVGPKFQHFGPPAPPPPPPRGGGGSFVGSWVCEGF